MSSAYARVDDRWQLSGISTIILESDQLRVVILPGAGAHVQQITHKPSDTDLLFENPRVDPYPPIFGEPWSGWLGGIDEMIPTGWACRHQGERYPDHGDVIARPWRYDVLERGPNAASVRLFCDGFFSPIRVERTMTLLPGELCLQMQHSVKNFGEAPYDFLWGLHTSFRGDFDYRIDLPAETVYEEHYRDRFFDGGPIARYTWPCRTVDGRTIDMRRPQPGPPMLLHYAIAEAGWFAFTDLDRQIGTAVTFDAAIFPVLGLWVLRGRAGHKLAAVSPWTGYPVRLSDAASEDGLCARLQPGELLTTSTRWIVYRNISAVESVSSAGEVIAQETA